MTFNVAPRSSSWTFFLPGYTENNGLLLTYNSPAQEVYTSWKYFYIRLLSHKLFNHLTKDTARCLRHPIFYVLKISTRISLNRLMIFFLCYIAWRGHSNYFSVLFIAGYAKTMWRDLAVMLHGSNYCVDVFPDRVRNTVIRISSFILLLPD